MTSTSSSIIHQGILLKHINTIFPGVETHTDVHKPLNIKYPSTGGYLEFDVWLPAINLCFEFQDSHHYITTWYYQRGQSHIRHVDSTKKSLARQKSISLVVVPCWWNGDLESIKAIINFERPDLIPESDITFDLSLISLNPPPDYFPEHEIPHIGELMFASFPRDTKLDISQDHLWWAGEKYDGMRFCFNPILKQVYSRQAKEVILPTSLFGESFPPNIFIDGEFWFGRGQYPTIHLLVNASDITPFQYLRALSFDIPSHAHRSLPFEYRYSLLLSYLPHDNPFLGLAVRLLVNSHKNLKLFLQAIISEEGEGLILRKYSSRFEPGRSKLLIKIKTVQADREGIVVRVSDDKSVLLKLPNGELLKVPAKDIEVSHALSLGSIVTFSYEAHARRDLPVSPKIYLIRTDVQWEDVVRNYRREQQYLSDSSQVREAGFKAQPLGHWTKKTMREFLEGFVRTKGMNPRVSSTWYNSDIYESICRSKKGRAIIQKCRGGYAKTIQYLFPELSFDVTKFPKSWVNFRIRRKFFENYAKASGFDPLHTESWYKQSPEAILSTKGAGRVMLYHRNSISQALVDLFPNIGIDREKFTESLPMLHYSGNRRKFFTTYAKEHKFDPLIAENWYSIPPERFLSSPGGKSVLVYYKYNVARALIDLFPNINLVKSKFLYYWRDVKNRRRFFEEYAKEEGFNPLVANNWYERPIDKIMANKSASRVLFYHNHSVVQALIDLFPDIEGLRKEKFNAQYLKHDFLALRKFFENYAQTHTFDPLVAENWYQQPTSRILYSKTGAKGVSVYFQGSVPKALRAVFPSINLDLSKFPNPRHDFVMERRKFFENYAKENNFDPLVATNWYHQPIDHIMESKGAMTVLSFYRSSVPRALTTLFPDIGLDSTQLNALRRR